MEKEECDAFYESLKMLEGKDSSTVSLFSYLCVKYLGLASGGHEANRMESFVLIDENDKRESPIHSSQNMMLPHDLEAAFQMCRAESSALPSPQESKS